MQKQACLALGLTIALFTSLVPSPFLSAQTPPLDPIKLDVPYVPTPEGVVMGMLQLAKVNANDVIYDLGSGDGRLVITAAQKFGAKRGVGVEINPGLVNRSNENARQAGVSDRVQFIQQDLFQTNFSDASIVTLYLLPKINLELRPKLLSELKPGSRVVSHAFGMGDWKPDQKILVDDNGRPRAVYLWVIPANVSGNWQGTLSTKSGQTQAYQVKLDQTFQKVRGLIAIDGETMSVPNISLMGDRLSFEHHQKLKGQEVNIRFNGQVTGSALQGNAEVKTKTSTDFYTLRANRQ